MNLTQANISELCQCGLATVKRWEKETPMNVDTLLMLKDYGFNIEYLLFGKENNSSNLSENENRLIQALRKLDPSQQICITDIVDGFAQFQLIQQEK